MRTLVFDKASFFFIIREREGLVLALGALFLFHPAPFYLLLFYLIPSHNQLHVQHCSSKISMISRLDKWTTRSYPNHCDKVSLLSAHCYLFLSVLAILNQNPPVFWLVVPSDVPTQFKYILRMLYLKRKFNVIPITS